ncbi:MAG: magnesium/cobalt transporter CorA [Rhodothermales bacterium]|nr:magnesium/cobalt transporter CorA [Rhodothermales bacterium]
MQQTRSSPTMGFYFRKRSFSKGLAPGSLVYGGVPREAPPSLDAIIYGEDHFEARHLDSLDDLEVPAGKLLWLNVCGVHDTGLLGQIGQRFGLHDLGMEDVASTLQRAKVDDYGDHIFATIRMFTRQRTEGMFSEQVTLAIGRDFVISFQERPGDVFDSVRERLKKGAGRLRRTGPDYLAYALMDVIVDDYFVSLEAVSDSLEELENDVLEGELDDTTARLRQLRATLIMTRRAAWPLREAVARLLNREMELVQQTTLPYIRDLHDHVVQVMDIVESLRDVVGSIHDLHMASISNRMNEIMKFLTIIGTIFIPLTFVAGIYGMNFVWMPELTWKWGYPVALGSMVIMAGLLIRYFRKKHWL